MATPKLFGAPIDDPDGEGKYLEERRPPQTEEWSIPPILTDELSSTHPEESIRLRQGIVCEVILDSEYLFQNVNMNEDDLIDFSLHGDPEGIWGQLNTHSFVRANTTIYFINRTHKDVLYLATFKQNQN